jgi:hypothetical protein
MPTSTKAAQNSIPGRKTISALWIIIITALVVVAMVSTIYLLRGKRRKSEKVGEEVVSLNKENHPNTTLYDGKVKLTIRAPIYLSQMQALENCLKVSPDLRVELISGSADEGNQIIISIDKHKPILLVEVLRAMPPVKQAFSNNDEVVIELRPPL